MNKFVVKHVDPAKQKHCTNLLKIQKLLEKAVANNQQSEAKKSQIKLKDSNGNILLPKLTT